MLANVASTMLHATRTACPALFDKSVKSNAILMIGAWPSLHAERLLLEFQRDEPHFGLLAALGDQQQDRVLVGLLGFLDTG